MEYFRKWWGTFEWCSAERADSFADFLADPEEGDGLSNPSLSSSDTSLEKVTGLVRGTALGTPKVISNNFFSSS